MARSRSIGACRASRHPGNDHGPRPRHRRQQGYRLGDREGVARGRASRPGLARSATTIALSGTGLERFTGNALKAGDVATALDGVDVVVQELGVPVRDLLGPVTLFLDATNVFVPAMEKTGVRRILAVTGFGTGDSRDAIGLLQRVPFRLVFGRAYDDKDSQEMRICRSGLDWTFVRPGVLTPGLATGHYKVLTERPSWRNGLISRADVAHFIVGQVDRPTSWPAP
jgi:putative NADH-flavin reductase